MLSGMLMVSWCSGLMAVANLCRTFKSEAGTDRALSRAYLLSFGIQARGSFDFAPLPIEN